MAYQKRKSSQTNVFKNYDRSWLLRILFWKEAMVKC